MIEYKEYELKDVCSRLSSGKGIPAAQVHDEGNFPVYGGNGLRGYTDHSNFVGSCAIIGRQGAFCGNVRFFSGEAYMTEHAVVVCANPEHNTHYLAYLLSMMNLGRLSGQSAQPGLSVKTLAKQIIKLPSLDVQNKVVAILETLENKIALNNKINDNLEQQTQALYQKYFPETDNAGKLADLCDFSKDKIAVSELNVKNYFSTENMLPDKKGTTEAANLPAVEQTTACHIGNVLVSNIRPYFKKILYCHCEGGCSTDVLCFVPKILELSAYLYCTLYADKFFDFMVAGSKGTKMPRGDKKQIMTYSVCLPSENELKNFNAAVLPMFQLIESNRRENARLSLLRDTLLPKLMAGEI